MKIPASSLRLLVQGLEALGTPAATCAQRIGVHPDFFRRDGGTTPSQALALVDFAIETAGPSFGVQAGLAIPNGRLGLVDHLCGAALLHGSNESKNGRERGGWSGADRHRLRHPELDHSIQDVHADHRLLPLPFFGP